MSDVMPGFDVNVVIAFLVGIFLLFLIGKMMLKPVKWVLKFIYNGLVGGVILWIVNLIGAQFGFVLAVNPLTALVVGFLGVPGVILLVVLKFVMK